jgi:hypothetical protein
MIRAAPADWWFDPARVASDRDRRDLKRLPQNVAESSSSQDLAPKLLASHRFHTEPPSGGLSPSGNGNIADAKGNALELAVEGMGVRNG